MCSSLIPSHTYHHHHGMTLSSSTFSDGIFSQPTLYSPTSKAKHIIKHCNVVHNPNMSRSMLFVFLLPYIPVSKTLFLILCISWMLNLFTGSFLSFSSHTLFLSLKKCDDCWCFCALAVYGIKKATFMKQ